MRKHPLFQMGLFGAVVCAILLWIALSIHWFPSEASSQLGRTRTLYEVLLIVSIPIFVTVLTVILFSVWKFRLRPGEADRDGPPIHGNTRLEVTWTAVPAVLILGLCGYSYAVLHANERTTPHAMVVNVTARQFAFEFSYRNGSGQTVVSPQLYLPSGQPVVFHLRSLDVVHSFFVPQFAEKLDAVPGIVTTVRVTPTHTGSYPVECTELCGAGHSLMRAGAEVVSPAAFRTWLATQKANTAPPVGNPPAAAAQPGVPGSKTPVPNPKPPKE